MKRVRPREMSWGPRFRVGADPAWIPGDIPSVEPRLVDSLGNRITRVLAEIGPEGSMRLGFERPLVPGDVEWEHLHEELLGDAPVPNIRIGALDSNGSEVWGQVFSVTGAHGYLPFVRLDYDAPLGSFVMERIVLWAERVGGVGMGVPDAE